MRKKIMSSVCGCMSYISYVIIFIILAVFVFVLLVPKTTRETFQLGPRQISSRELYKTSKNFDADFKTMYSTLSDSDDMLVMSGCYQYTAPGNTWDPVFPGCLVKMEKIYTASFNDVRSKIIAMLQDMKNQNKGQNFDGPAYVWIEQAPFMRDDKGNVITMQFNVRSYNSTPINLMRTGSSVDDMKKPLFFRIIVILTSYYQNMMKRLEPYDLRMALLPYKSKKDQCFISCIGDPGDSYCGCLNRDLDPADNKSYASKCSATPISMDGSPVDTTKNVEANFAILYNLNTKSSDIVQANVFNS